MEKEKLPNDAGGNDKQIRSLDNATEEMIRYAEERGISTVFSNIKKGCQLGLFGVCCRQCSMGPCGKDKGKCGADADTIVARNWLMEVARGTACHASHALHVAIILLKVALSETTIYKIKDSEKLKAIAAKLKIDTTQGIKSIAEQVAMQAISDIIGDGDVGDKDCMNFLSFLPPSVIENLFRVGVIPNSVAKDNLVVGHMTSFGVMADYESLMMWSARMGVADVVSMIICTELQDVLLGIPKIIYSEIGFGALDKRKVNIVVHGHDPLFVEKILEVLQKKRYLKKAKELGASGINIVGCCCTGNELLMRHGIHLAGSNLQQELIITTGLVEAFVVDVQCIFPNIVEVSKCFHTKVITTSEVAKIRGAKHIPFNVEGADKAVRKIINLSINNFKKRNKEIIHIPKAEPKKIIAGFSVETCLEMFSKINPGDPLEPLISAIKKGDILGIVLLAGCTSPKIVADANHVAIARNLIKKNILVVATGCAAQACGRAGLLNAGATQYAGDKLKNMLSLLGEAGQPLPPVWHMGSCTDNGRAVVIISAIAEKMGIPISGLPIAASAAEWVAEKATAIGMGAMAIGITTHLGTMPPILGSEGVIKLFTKDFESYFGGKFIIETDPVKAANRIIKLLKDKREKLGIGMGI